MKIDVHSRQSDITGEGPLWSVREQALYWVDIGGRRLYRSDSGDARPRAWDLPHHPGCLAELPDGRIAVAMGDGVHALDPASGAIIDLDRRPPMRPGTRFNDGKVDPQGRLWAGTMQNNFGPGGESLPIERPDGALFRFDRGGGISVIEQDLMCANTLAWSPDGTRFYFADSLPGAIFAYDYDPESGAVSGKRVLFDEAGLGVPDGSAIDVDGCLWNARWGASAIVRITPEGRIDRRIEMPVPRPTSCMFGGPNLDILFVTSATNGLGAGDLAAAPLSGSVFAITGAGQGVAVPMWEDASS